MLNKYNILVMGCIMAACCLMSCNNTDPPPGKADVVIQVNGSKITLDEFNAMLKLEVYANPELELTEENRDEFIDYIVRKELMIQEAVRLKLDRNEKFMRAIEKYWEASLIRNLHDLKAEEIKKQTMVTDNEIKEYYQRHQADLGGSLSEVKDQIRTRLEAQKRTTAMEAWTQDLIKTADIKIDKQRISR